MRVTLFILKILAMLTMTIDHVASSFLGNMTALRVIGRLAFLLYAFMIAEGFNHIKDKPDRVRSHLIKLSVLCVISEFVYDFYETGELIDWSSQSVMPVLLLGFIGLIITEKCKDRPWIYILFYIASAFATYFMKTNYKFAGVLLIYAFYFYLKYEGNRSYPVKLLILLAIMSVYFAVSVWARTDFGGPLAFLAFFKRIMPWTIGHVIAVPVIAAYNGKPGPRNKALNMIYSVYYPAHMALLGTVLLFTGK